MTSTPDDPRPETTAGAAAPHVPEPPATGDTPAAPAPGSPDSAAWGTTSSPVYGAGAPRPTPSADETQPLRLDDTRPLTWAPPAAPAPSTTPPGVVPSGAGPAAPPYGSHQAYAPPAPGQQYGAPQHGNPPSPGTPSPGAASPGTPSAGAPPYGSPPPYGTPPAGGSPYGAPAYGAPGSYGAPGPYGAPGQVSPYPPSRPTDGLAVASLVTSVGGLVLLAGATGPIGIGLGIGALARVRRTGAQGRGMAIAGIVVGAVGTALLAFIVFLTVAFIQAVATTTEQAQEALGGPGLEELLQDGGGTGLEDLLGEGGTGGSGEQLDGLLDELQRQLEDLEAGQVEVLPSYALPQDLAAGTCWVHHPETYDLTDTVVAPCTSEHRSEVVARLTVTGAPATDLTLPDPVLAAAQEQCTSAVAAIDPGLLALGSTDVWLPHPDQVAAGQTVGYCVFHDALGSGSSLVAPTGAQP